MTDFYKVNKNDHHEGSAESWRNIYYITLILKG